jgi:Uma2 family endonuclease
VSPSAASVTDPANDAGYQGIGSAGPPDDVLAWEARQAERYEFIGGVLRIMVGGTAAHNIITGNLRAALRAAVRGTGCQVFSETMKVMLPGGDFAYPDVVVTCRPIAPGDDRVTQPALIAEALPRSTAEYDRGTKADAYQAIPPLHHLLLVTQDRRRVDLYRRTAEGWEIVRITAGQIPLPALDCTIDLDALYEDAGC